MIPIELSRNMNVEEKIFLETYTILFFSSLPYHAALPFMNRYR